MKPIPILLPILFALVITSCKTQPTTTKTVTVEGHVGLFDAGVGYTPPYSGIQVSLEGTSYSAVTDDSGFFQIDNVPENNYNVNFSKAGYGSLEWIGSVLWGGGHSIDMNSPGINTNRSLTLFKQPNFVPTITSATFIDTEYLSSRPAEYLCIKGNYSSSRSISSGSYDLAVYLSHYSDLSPEKGHYEYIQCGMDSQSVTWDSLDHTFEWLCFIEDQQLFDFKPGDSVYVSCYGAPNYGLIPLRGDPPQDYFDPLISQYVLTALNQTSSPIIGLKIP